jgi:hypothetical protein
MNFPKECAGVKPPTLKTNVRFYFRRIERARSGLSHGAPFFVIRAYF